jgi:hypothetical protein
VTEEKNRQDAEMIELTADIVAAFVQNNAVPVAGLPVLISSVNSALRIDAQERRRRAAGTGNRGRSQLHCCRNENRPAGPHSDRAAAMAGNKRLSARARNR